VYFDGTGDYFTSSTSLFNYTTANAASQTFTIEAWVYHTARTTPSQIYYSQPIAIKGTVATGAVYMNLGINDSGNLIFYHFNGGQISFTGSSVIPLSTWTHVAVVVSGGTATLYVNGVSAGSGTWYGIAAAGQNTTSIFGFAPGGLAFNGYISNLRVSSNARSISVPVAPYANDATTDFLTCQSPTVIDNSNNALAITVNGNAQPSKYNPFGETVTTGVEYSPTSHGGSVYFDGTGDYLTVAGTDAFAFGTGDFTVECWALQPDINAGTRIIASSTPFGSGNTGWALYFGAGFVAWLVDNANRIVSSSAINPGTWNHISIVRSSGSTKMYINGVQTGSTYSDSTNYSGTAQYIGGDPTQNYFGYISNFRAIKGTSLYTSSFVPPAAPPTPIPGTTLLLNGTNAAIYDATGRNVLETVGNARVVNGVKKYGTGAMYFDGTGDWLLLPNNPDIQLGTGNFTIEFWIYLNTINAARGFVAKGGASTGWLVSLVSTNTVRFTFTTSTITSTGTLAASTWYHIAVVREGTGSNQTKIYINGTNDGTGTVSTDFNQTESMYIGANRTGGDALNGYIDDLRITKGVARYTANFTPPISTYKLR
jgi:hypothetical protein